MQHDAIPSSPSTPSSPLIDTGLASLIMLLRFHGIAADAKQIAHLYNGAIGVTEMLRCAKDMKVKARVIESSWERLKKTPLPAIAERSDGTFFIIAKLLDESVLIQDPLAGRPQTLARTELEAQWSGRLVLMTRRAGLGELVRRFDVTWFLQAMHKYRRLLTEVLVASFFLQLFALVSPLFFQVIIDKVLVHRGMTTLDVLVIGLVSVGLFESILTALRTYLFAHTTSRIDVELGARLFRHLVALPIAYFGSRRAGDSVARVRELENIRNFLTSSALTLVIDLFFTFVFLAVMAYYSASLTILVLCSFPFYIVISVLVTPVFRHRLNDKFNRGAENQSFLVESITGIETLKSMAVEPQMQRKWEEQLAGYVKASFRVVNLGNWSSQGVQLVNKLTTAALLFFGAKAVMDGDMTVGELVAFNMLAGRVAQPVLRLAQMLQDFHQARLSVARLGDILNTQPEPMFSPGRTALPEIKGKIDFEHVTFRYKVDGQQILHDINLSIKEGEVVGIVGPSGSGKSTLGKLVQRLYVPESGRVLIDGVDLAVVDVSWLRRQVGVVLQENILFNASIRDNIALSDPGMPIEHIINAAKLAGAHEFILELPEGYDTNVGERGSSLSGGQRQRIAIVRAIHVQDGQAVKQGDVLIEIDSTVTEAERDRLQKESIEAELDAARLKAALDLSDDPTTSFIPPEGSSDVQIATQKTLLINQVREIKAKLDSLNQQIAQQQGNEAAVKATVAKLTESMPYLQKRADARKSLLDQGYGSKLDYYAAKQDLIEHQQEVQVQTGRLAEAQGAVASLQQQLKQAEAEYQHKNLSDLDEAQQKASSLHEQLVQAAQKYRLQTLTAPVDGTVQQLAVHTEGGVVTPAQILMAIVPADSKLEIEANISNKDIGFIRAGQDAAIKVDTFNFTRYGLLHGKVMTVSQDAITRDKPQNGNDSDKQQTGAENDTSEPKGQELVYMARVYLDDTQMQIDDRLVNLSPGMAVTVEIKTGSRHIISYLLSPIKKHMSQAMRER